MASPPGIKLFSILVFFFINLLATELGETTLAALFLALQIVRLLLKIFLLTLFDPFEIFFNLSKCGPNTCETSGLNLSSLQALPSRERLQEVLGFLVEAMATSADTFIALFLSIRLIPSDEWQILRPIAHLLRNSCFNELEACILGRFF